MKYAKYFAIALASLATVGCTGDFEDINKNPNSIEVGGMAPYNLIEPLLIDGANTLMSHMYEYNNEISQITAAINSNVDDKHRYVLADAQFIVPFREYYRRAMDAKHICDLAARQGDPNWRAIGLTMKVFYLSKVADLYGSIAYTEALRGSEGVLRPRIESQQEAYLHMMEELEEANSYYNLSQTLTGRDKDAMYNGDIAKWKKFTNSLHLRILMRVSGRNNDFTPSVGERIAAIVNNPATYPVFESDADAAAVKYSAADVGHRSQFNPQSYTNQEDFSSNHKLSEQLISMTVDSATGEPFDPRLYVWGKTRQADDWKWRGAASGCSSGYGNDLRQYCTYLHYETLVNETNPNYLMDYAELLFIKAEAALKGWIAGGAEQYYNAALTASCQKWSVYGANGAFPEKGAVSISSADIDAFLADPRVAYSAANAERLIAEQKWLSLFWIAGFEQYSEMRRTGYPAVAIGSGAIAYNRTNGKFPARFAYPTIALANNYNNYMSAIDEMGGNGEESNNMILPLWYSGQAVAADKGTPWPHSFRTLTTDNR